MIDILDHFLFLLGWFLIDFGGLVNVQVFFWRLCLFAFLTGMVKSETYFCFEVESAKVDTVSLDRFNRSIHTKYYISDNILPQQVKLCFPFTFGNQEWQDERTALKNQITSAYTSFPNHLTDQSETFID